MAKDWCDIRRGCINPSEYLIVLIFVVIFFYVAFTMPFTATQFLFGIFYLLFAVDYFAKQLNILGVSFIIFLIQWGCLILIGKFFFIDKLDYSSAYLGLLIVSVLVLVYATKKRAGDVD